jgi:diguanylate cyclase (GGDEF)-like protein
VLEARRFTNAEAGTLFLVDGDVLRFAVAQNDELARRVGVRKLKRRFEAAPLPLHSRSLAGHVARTGQVLNVDDAYRLAPNAPYAFSSEWDARNGYRTRALLVVPLTDRSRHVIGVLQLINARGPHGEGVRFEPDYEPLVRALAAQAAAAITNIRLTEWSLKDALTGGYNRRYFSLRLDEEIKRSERFDHPLSLVLLDVDRFKEINDAHGHAAGDAVLTEVARILTQHSRSFTIVARLGGDEFVALLANTPKSSAVAYAERMRGLIASHPFPHGPLTASFGVACLPAGGAIDRAPSSLGLLQVADAALYEAKRQGRNRVASR